KLIRFEPVPGLQVPPLHLAQLRISVAESHSPKQKSLLRNTSGGPNRSSLLPSCQRRNAAPRRAGSGKREQREAGAGKLSNPTSTASGSDLTTPQHAAHTRRPALPSSLSSGAIRRSYPAPAPLSRAAHGPASEGGQRGRAPPLTAAAARGLPRRWQLLRTRGPGAWGRRRPAASLLRPWSIPGASPEHLRGQPGTPGTSPCERGQERSAEWQRAAEEVIYVDGFARPAVLAELRAAVFLALEEQEKVELNGLDGRENLARDLGITEAEGTMGGPLLLEVVRKCQQKKIPGGGEVAPVLSDSQCPTSKSSDGRSSAHSIPNKAADKIQSDTSVSSGEASKRSIHFLPNEAKLDPQLENKDLNTKEKSDPVMDEDDVEGDSFFDDPIPKPERTYGWKTEANKGGGLASLSDAPPLKSGLSSLTGAPLLKESDNLDRNSVLKDLRLVNAKLGSLELGNGDDDEYADDFNSTSHRSEKSDISIGEEIDELSVGTEESNASDKLESITQDLTISQLSDVADYLEDVA
uniref:Centrosomal protein 43 n=1 Tax=Corvus moneduloides TaxID=1196302 RepID=A0A8C3DPU8_CORMO